MDHASAAKVLASLSGDPVTFRYFKDRFALQLLAYTAWEGRSPSALRRGRFRSLLQKPSVRRVFGERGGRDADWDLLDSYFPEGTEEYALTLDVWSNEHDAPWRQTSRPGFNVVLQLNLPRAHERAYQRYVKPREDGPFVWGGHPVNSSGHATLAWSRLDIDDEGGEALIEEIQSDWVRLAEGLADEALTHLVEGLPTLPEWLDSLASDPLDLFRYVEHVLAPHRRMWHEAVLAASLWLLRERLGIRHVWLHTFETGCEIKHLGRWGPPRSLYEQLPRSFCFERVGRAPGFLRDHLARTRTLSGCEFWYLRL